MVKPLWFFGDAVQDITVEIDLDRLSREHADIRNSIRLVDQRMEIREGLWLKTLMGLQRYAVHVEITDATKSADDFHQLFPGKKYTLSGEINDSFPDASLTGLVVPCENVSWGGGGVNNVTFMRSVAPVSALVPIRYTDIAMSRSLPKLPVEFDSFRRDLENKIILRGQYDTNSVEEKITQLLRPHSEEVGAMILNSLKDGPLFRAAYSLYSEANRNNSNVVAILAMTDSMQRFADDLMTSLGVGKFPPLILVLNEDEAVKFARRLQTGIEPFMVDSEDFPDICKFGRVASALMSLFPRDMTPRIYVTCGPRGSLGVDGIGPVVYAGAFAKPGSTIYDTNACGDAYCTTIALLEWAKRNGHENIAEVEYGQDHLASAKGMAYFMSVATAVAFAKASIRCYRALSRLAWYRCTNRRPSFSSGRRRRLVLGSCVGGLSHVAAPSRDTSAADHTTRRCREND